jgi:hypothetical protein
MAEPRDYAREFDEHVSRYNQWLASLENPEDRTRNKVRTFFGGFINSLGSLLNVFGNSPRNSLAENNPIYSDNNLSSEQKDAIALASDWKRAGKELDKILSGESKTANFSLSNAKSERQIAQKVYNHLKEFYVASAMRG